MAPARLCPTRTPMSYSGKITRVAPTRSRIFPCGAVIAFATIFGIFRSTSTEVVRMLASTAVPMATTAVSKSAAPSWRSDSMSVESASTTWVSMPEYSCTTLALESTPRTSWPSSTSVSASPPPKRPRPITRNSFSCLANDGPFLGETVKALALAQGERDGKRIRACSTQVHERYEDELGGVVQVRRDSRREPDRAEGGDSLVERLRETELA